MDWWTRERWGTACTGACTNGVAAARRVTRPRHYRRGFGTQLQARPRGGAFVYPHPHATRGVDTNRGHLDRDAVRRGRVLGTRIMVWEI